MGSSPFVLDFSDITLEDIPLVGGKNASLGEMHRHLTAAGVRVPGGFAVTAAAYRHVLDQAGAWPRLEAALDGLDTEDVADLEARSARARQIVLDAGIPSDLRQAIEPALAHLHEGTAATSGWP